MRSRVLAVDPGVATGWATRQPSGHVRWGIDEQMGFCDFAQAWVSLAVSGVDDVIVCESYRITAGTTKMTFQPASLEIIGFLRWLCHRNGVKFVLQQPAEKRFMTDGKLKALGWWTPGSAGHDHDALRHLGVYVAKVEKDMEVLRARG